MIAFADCARFRYLGIVALCNGSIAAILKWRSASAGRTAGADGPGRRILSIPNLITLARILLVPVLVWAITSGEMRIAFLLFLAAGLSDAVDGFLAKRFGMATALGAYLDPLADKAMIVSIYVALGIADAIPLWLVILVVSRDIMIVGAVILSWLVDKPVHAQAAAGLQAQHSRADRAGAAGARDAGLRVRGARAAQSWRMALVAVLTLLSIAFYLAEWVRHMNATEAGH